MFALPETENAAQKLRTAAQAIAANKFFFRT